MSATELRGEAQTVLGPVAPDSLGVTLPHEHLLTDVTCLFAEPEDPAEKTLAHQPVTIENLGWIRYHVTSNLDNLRLSDETTAVNEASVYRQAGGQTIVDASNVGLKRNPLGLARIARATGLHIVMGSG